MSVSAQHTPPQSAKSDHRLNILARLLLILSLIIALGSLYQLPDRIPIHFNARGAADGFGSKYTLLLLPAIFTLVFLLLGFLKKAPHRFNYPVTITPENRDHQYRLAQGMCTWLQLATGFLSLLLVLCIRHSALNGHTPLGPWLIVVSLCIYTVPSIIYLTHAFKKQPL